MSIIAWNPLFLTKKIDRFDVKTAFRCFLSHFSVCEPILITYFYSKRVIPNYEWPRSIRLCRNQCNVLDLTIFNKLFKLLVAIAFSIFYRRVENSIRDHWNSYLPIANVCKPFISRILIAVHALCHTVFWLRAGTNSRLRSWIIDHHFSVKWMSTIKECLKPLQMIEFQSHVSCFFKQRWERCSESLNWNGISK